MMQLAASGAIQASTLVWREGLGDWQTLSQAMPAALGSSPYGGDAPQIGGVAVPMAQKDMLVQQMREGVMTRTPGGMEYAGFWIRWVAKVLDLIIFFIILVILLGVLAGLLYAMGLPLDPDANHGGAPPVGFIILMIVYYGLAIFFPPVYCALMVGKYGATWGKMALGLRVVNEDGSKVTMGRAFGRGFAEMLSGMTCDIGYIIAGFDSEKRSLHDHICSTRVIYKR